MICQITKKTISLKHNELPAKVDTETGELTIIEHINNIPNDKEVFEPSALFGKYYQNSWAFLIKYLTSFELGIVAAMCHMADMNTNSLKPLDENATITVLTEYFDISEKKVKSTFKKLFDIGVYGRFEVADATKDYTKYWILNPYLCFRGKIIDSKIKNLFSGTHIAKSFKNSNYEPVELELVKKKSNRRTREKSLPPKSGE